MINKGMSEDVSLLNQVKNQQQKISLKILRNDLEVKKTVYIFATSYAKNV